MVYVNNHESQLNGKKIIKKVYRVSDHVRTAFKLPQRALMKCIAVQLHVISEEYYIGKYTLIMCM